MIKLLACIYFQMLVWHIGLFQECLKGDDVIIITCNIMMSGGVAIVVVGDTSNFHFDTIPSSLGISIDGIKYYTDT